MSDTIRNGVASGIHDLSKGFVPVTLLLAMLGSAVYVGQKVERMRGDQATTAARVEEVKAQLDGLSPLIGTVAALQAEARQQQQTNGEVERDLTLVERDVRAITIALGKRGIDVQD